MDPKAKPVDLSVLARQSGGDAALEREVLLLFADQVPRDLARLHVAPSEERPAVAHRIVGSAGAVGAIEVARLAAAIEGGSGDIAALGDAIGEACAFIREHVAGRSAPV